jgi:two-component system sensor histidine kinase MprB
MLLRARHTLAGRVGLLATLAVGIVVALVSVAGYFTVRHQLFESLDRSLYKRAEVAASAGLLEALASQRIPSDLLGAGDVKMAFVDADGTITTGDLSEAHDTIRIGEPEIAVARGDSPRSCRTIETGSGAYRVATVPSGEPGTALVLAQSLESTDYTLGGLGWLVAFYGAAVVLVAGLAGWAVARQGLRPVRRLTEAAEEIARTEQLEPIPVEGTDEIARLASAFNAMLTALAASRDRQRRLVGDASHELRTPLTSLRTNLELLAQAESRGGLSDASRAELLSDVRAQLEELTTLVGDLTELARDEPVPHQVETVDLADVVERALDRVRRRAGGLQFSTTIQPWWVVGDAAALERAVTNLLDNAAKWSPPLGVVTVRLVQGTLYVADQGGGIAESDLPHIFDRFYRSPESRTMPGSGLGLAIVRRVAERHGGTVSAGAAPGGGAAFWFDVPGSTRPPAQQNPQPAPSRLSAPAQPVRGESVP